MSGDAQGLLPTKSQKSRRKISLPWFRQNSVTNPRAALSRQHTIDSPGSFRFFRQPSASRSQVSDYQNLYIYLFRFPVLIPYRRHHAICCNRIGLWALIVTFRIFRIKLMREPVWLNVYFLCVFVWVLRSTPIARHLSYRRSGKSNETEFLFLVIFVFIKLPSMMNECCLVFDHKIDSYTMRRK